MLLLLSTGFAVSSVHAQTAEEMVSRCRNMVNARVVDDKVQIPRDFDSGVCWGAFLSYEEAITYVGHEYLDGTIVKYTVSSSAYVRHQSLQSPN